jgi:hypothetical protein
MSNDAIFFAVLNGYVEIRSFDIGRKQILTRITPTGYAWMKNLRAEYGL